MNTIAKLVSIIVPIYNSEKYLHECVDSIILQTYRELEIILVDDGSLDSSGKICDEYAHRDRRVKVIHKTNGGVSSARNVGIDAAHGEYIMFVDSDDKITSICIEKMILVMEEENLDIVSAGSLNSNSEKYFVDEHMSWDGDNAVKQSLSDHPFTFSIWAKLYQRDIIGETRYCDNIKINEDALFLFEIFCKRPKVVNIKDKVYFYRHNLDSASNAKYSEKFEDILMVSQRKYEIVEELFPDLLYLADNMMLKARMNLLKILCTRTWRKKKELESELIRYIKKNAKSYISNQSKHDDQWVKIIKFNLYYVYKLAYWCLKRNKE